MRFAATLLLLTAFGCSSADTGPNPRSPTRAFRMGFSALPPKIDQDVAVQSLLTWSTRADIAIVHEELPWTELLDGTPPDTILRREKDGLIEFYRGKGFRLVFIADANDGLAREVNTAAADLRALASPPELFVSVQVEVGWGKLINQPYQGIETDFADFPFLDLLGLSSYPYFGWPSPADLPDDYYRRLLNGRTLPVMIVEGGWASGSGPGFTSSEAVQADYFRRQTALLERVDAIGWIQLTPTDLDLTGYPPDLRQLLQVFGTLGVLDASLAPKLALRVWDSVFARRLR